MTTSTAVKLERVRPRKDEGRQRPLGLDDLIRKRPLAKRLGVSPWTIDRWRKIGAFPPPIELSATVLAWRVSDIEAWLRTRRGGEHADAS